MEAFVSSPPRKKEASGSIGVVTAIPRGQTYQGGYFGIAAVGGERSFVGCNGRTDVMMVMMMRYDWRWFLEESLINAGTCLGLKFCGNNGSTKSMAAGKGGGVINGDS
ncbi:uncharacterized protein DFL_004711 [Arthrobotrys flagrans]|uniref:Uncharacterized protein n=1 Tax=Arthrobotrys flagrans TaxID=97331 RepID=A0A437A5N7_ARTFL|nr:hypothetical protein DFL_004711 [Arthrobotrys flagrans]